MAKRVQDLECWQLANHLRGEVTAICELPAVARHFKFCEGFAEAAGSVCRNVSEGFGRFGSGQIVQFFTYAVGSLEEVKDYLAECLARKFIDGDRFARVNDVAEHTRATIINFMKPHRAKLQRQSSRKSRSPRT